MADRYTTIFGDQIDATALGAGLVKDVDDNIEVNVDDVTLEIDTDVVQVKDEGIDTAQLKDDAVTNIKILDDTIAEPKLDIFNAPVNGYYLKWTTANGMEWADVDADAVQNDDVIVGEIPSGTIGGGNPTFTLANTPITGTVAVYLNGLRQSEGSGEDYTISGNTITFVKAPRPNSVLLADYIRV